MSRFYVDVKQVGNKIYVREIVDGLPLDRKLDFSPTLYTNTPNKTEFSTVKGENLQEIRFSSVQEAKEFIKKYKDVDNFPIYGNTQLQYQWITKHYPDTVDFDMSKIKIATVDVETSVEEGFPNIMTANEEILLISVKDYHTKKTITFGSTPFSYEHMEHMKDPTKFTYVCCENESDLLQSFLRYWSSDYPHIVTGWNTKFFDIPYLVHRIQRVLGDEYAKLLSPWKMLREKDIYINAQAERTYEIYGIAHIDYLDAYKKYSFSGTQENYKLDHIATVELKRKKLENPYTTFKDFYTKDWNRFVVYNVVDVDIVDELEEAKKLLLLVMTLAYSSHTNIQDAFSPVRMWESILHNHLNPRGIILPSTSHATGRAIEGAYVKEVVAGPYDWVVSFDAASLYPSIIMQYNMSPETLTDFTFRDVTVKSLLDKSVDTSVCVEKDICVVANGHTFSREKMGIFPEIIEEVFNKRKIAKKKMLEAERKYLETKDPVYRREEVIQNSIQQSYKVLANSLYGAQSNQYFVFYDDRIAEGITLTGQYVIKTTHDALNVYLNKIMKTSGVDYVIAVDTDSCYITLGGLVNTYFTGKSKEEIVDAIDKICKEKITPVINAACENLGDYTNAFQRKLDFKREVIADAGLWTAKKRYALNVYDSEGVRYSSPKQKVTGMEIVRSTTPSIVRGYLKKAMSIVLSGTESDLQDYILHIEKEMRSSAPEAISLPKGVNNLAKYTSTNSIYTKGCPKHVRGSLLFNHRVKQLGLDKQYPMIREGEKIKLLHLKMPNPIQENCICFVGTLPVELGLHKYIDYTDMIDKTFLDPLEKILDARGWTPRPVATLDSLF